MTEEKKAKQFGRGSHPCRRCGSNRGIIRRYNLIYCRRCFREVAKTLGFDKLE